MTESVSPSLTRTGVHPRARLGLAMLTLIFALNIVDRQIVTILAEDIKAELHLSDLQVGILTGLSFALVYMTSAVLIARLADTGNRRKIISCCVAVWSAMTTLCGFATSFPALLAARMGVAVGEAGCSPASFSLLADYYPPERRAFTIAVMQAGAVAGSAAALLVGGLLAEHYGWRTPLVAVGLIGLVIAALAFSTVAEPRAATQASAQARESFAEAFRFILRMRPFQWLLGAGALAGFGTFSLQAWMPAYYQRVFGWSVGTTGSVLAAATVIAGVAGALAIGRIADRRLAADPGAHCAIPAFMVALAVPPSLIMLFADNAWLSLAGLVAVYLFTNGWQPGVFATVQSLMHDRTRATAAAILGLVVNLAGVGLGPVVVGGLSDRLQPSLGGDALRYALLPSALAFAGAALALAMAARSIRHSVKGASGE
ncbi:putative MFS family arabinose efflux permease [Sphingopyxis sp. OAS728]|uniref:spinster family MFS transporter n=1 Tax=Sphingopyxis sp. OAS728 TaxID=2663823 RepID=UPI00178B4711|nr:MFS transporter [Sphingopyxis sp. OAS728]MBE1527987.1 putative MFS family arabinose efflux permease [Sphingopyxis sp. OAS728]